MRKGASFKDEVLHLFQDSRRGAGIAGAPGIDMGKEIRPKKRKGEAGGGKKKQKDDAIKKGGVDKPKIARVSGGDEGDQDENDMVFEDSDL